MAWEGELLLGVFGAAAGARSAKRSRVGLNAERSSIPRRKLINIIAYIGEQTKLLH
jgi:hypothetical protein